MINLMSKNVLNNNPGNIERFKSNAERLTTPVDFFWMDMGLIGGRLDAEGKK